MGGQDTTYDPYNALHAALAPPLPKAAYISGCGKLRVCVNSVSLRMQDVSCEDCGLFAHPVVA